MEKDMKIIEGLAFDQERALYNSKNVRIVNCKFAGPSDGESALKESSDLEIKDCYLALRYPLWHVNNCLFINSEMTEGCRAPVWYSSNMKFVNSKLHGPKNLRECESMLYTDCEIVSQEFGWKSKNINISGGSLEGEYAFLDSKKINIEKLSFKGKYSFQYTENLHIKNANLDTKDAFWHTKNALIEDSYVKGEYLGWYSENLKFVNCTIVGTQPLCYCKNLELVNCKMIDCDLSFENSSVNATIIGEVTSIKNPLSGTITVDSVKEVIMDDEKYNCHGKVVVR